MAVSEVILSLLITSIGGVIYGLYTVLYRSKCKTIDCFCIKIVRDVEGEEKLDQQEANHMTHNNLASV